MSAVASAGDYVLGTADEEIERLGVQHMVWRPRALDAWHRAGFNIGQELLDIGCGPGYASMDLADLVGSSGLVIALDRSPRFLQALERKRLARGIRQIETREVDLDSGELPRVEADGAWCRWLLSFVKRPRELLARIRGALRPGGVLVLHEYFDYGAWRLMPRSPEFVDFVRTVMESWRADGGEPNIVLMIPSWLAELGFELKSIRPILDVASPASLIWRWPKTFFQSGLGRLVQLGQLTGARAQTMAGDFAAREAAPHTLMITPAVLEIIAVRSFER
jgi:SAM-dependent methyltransferase